MSISKDSVAEIAGSLSDRHQINEESEAEGKRLRKVRRETLRRGLIASFIAQQASVCTYLSFPDVAKHWAPLRREPTLREAKESALDDLMEAAFDGHIPELLFLNPRAGVEDVIGSPWCKDNECPLNDQVGATKYPGRLGTKWFADQRKFGPPTETDHLYIMTQIAPDCWAPREAVVAFLRKRGVDSADIPESWARNLPGADTNLFNRPASSAITPNAPAGGMDVAEADSPLPHKRLLSAADKGRIFAKYRDEYPGALPPTYGEDVAYMRQHGVGREWVRAERDKYPRRRHGQKNPGTKSADEIGR
jgi:hypothetical protein